MRHVETPDYGTEVVLDMPNGMQLHADGEDRTGTSYVRVCDPRGVEVMYWNAEEWGEAPEQVMGAIIGALCAVEDGDPARAEPAGEAPMTLWVNDERTVLARTWSRGMAEVAVRETPAHVWGPPIECRREET